MAKRVFGDALCVAGWEEHMRRGVGPPPGASPYYYHPDMDRARGPHMDQGPSSGYDLINIHN